MSSNETWKSLVNTLLVSSDTYFEQIRGTYSCITFMLAITYRIVRTTEC